MPKKKSPNRHRKDMGNVTPLADSIKEEGLQQPIGVKEKLELVFAERRLRAYKDISCLPSILTQSS